MKGDNITHYDRPPIFKFDDPTSKSSQATMFITAYRQTDMHAHTHRHTHTNACANTDTETHTEHKAQAHKLSRVFFSCNNKPQLLVY